MVERGRMNFYKLTNNSGALLTRGMVVFPDPSADLAVRTTTTELAKNAFATVHDLEIANGEDGLFEIHGAIVPHMAASAAITRGNFVGQSTTPGAVEDTGTAADETSDPPAGAIGFALTADSDGMIVCFVGGSGAGSGGGGSGIQLVGISKFRDSDQTIPDSTNTPISWPSSYLITGAGVLWSMGTPTRLTIDTAYGGSWLLTACIRWDGAASGFRSIQIVKNGTVVLASNAFVAVGGSSDPEQICSAWGEVDDGDYIELIAYQESGGDTDVISANYYAPVLSIIAYRSF